MHVENKEDEAENLLHLWRVVFPMLIYVVPGSSTKHVPSTHVCSSTNVLYLFILSHVFFSIYTHISDLLSMTGPLA